MPLEMSSDRAICSKCGTAYGRRKGYFPVNYGLLYKGVGHLSICKECVDAMYDSYLAQCKDAKLAVRQMCRKLDLFWSDNVFEVVSRKSSTKTMMTQYLAKINTVTYAGKSYDDTLSTEGALWTFGEKDAPEITYAAEALERAVHESDTQSESVSIEDIPPDVIEFWGTGYEDDPNMYVLLEQRRRYWIDNLPDGIELDIGTKAVIRQICFLELDINRDRAAGKNVEKSVTALTSLINSSILKPAQKKTEDIDAATQNTPLGVWIYRYENERPLPEVDEDLRDVNGILKYVFIWLGHVCKMLGKKNGFSRLYEEEMHKWRVQKPEYDDEENDEEFLSDVLSSDEDGELDV